jgi:hypothetical protein
VNTPYRCPCCGDPVTTGTGTDYCGGPTICLNDPPTEEAAKAELGGWDLYTDCQTCPACGCPGMD